MLLDFTGRTAVITGGANGIGLACARALAAGGASVWILDLERERPADLATTFGARGAVADVTDRASLEAAFAQSGPPDIVVANAVAFLASDLASFITGAAPLVDGGQMASKFGTWDQETAEFQADRWRLK